MVQLYAHQKVWKILLAEIFSTALTWPGICKNFEITRTDPVCPNLNLYFQKNSSPCHFLYTVKIGEKEWFDKEQIGVKEPFSVTNLQFTS
jgi:hypothetical protein